MMDSFQYSMQALLSLAIGGLLLFALFIALLVLFLLPLRMKLRLQRNGLNGPPPVFPFGNLMEISERLKGTCSLSSVTHDIHSTVFPYFALWRKTYGKVFIYWLGIEPFLYIADPEFLKQVTSGALGKKWGKPNVFKKDRKTMFGKGLLMVEGDEWSLHRNIIAPAFSKTNLNSMISMMAETTSKMIEKWAADLSVGKNEIDVEKDVTINAAEIIASVSFGISDTMGRLVFEKLQTLQSVLFQSNRLVGVPLINLLHPNKSRKAHKLGEEIDDLLLSIVNSCRKGEKKSAVDGASHHDLLNLLLAANQENARSERKLTTRELVDECKTFFFAGHETTAFALTWTLFLLAMYPEWQKKLREEAVEVTEGRAS